MFITLILGYLLFSFTVDDTSRGWWNSFDYGTILIDLLRINSFKIRGVLWLIMMLLPIINLIKTSGQPIVLFGRHKVNRWACLTWIQQTNARAAHRHMSWRNYSQGGLIIAILQVQTCEELILWIWSVSSTIDYIIWCLVFPTCSRFQLKICVRVNVIIGWFISVQ